MKIKAFFMALLACAAFTGANMVDVSTASAEDLYVDEETYDSLEDGDILVDEDGNEYEVEVEYY